MLPPDASLKREDIDVGADDTVMAMLNAPLLEGKLAAEFEAVVCVELRTEQRSTFEVLTAELFWCTVFTALV